MTERFRKLPIEIEAVQWTGTNVTEMWAFASEKFDPIDPEDRGDDPEMTARVFDELHSTWVGMYDGQWVIKGVMGEFYPCADGVLRATYESAADDLAEVGAGRASTEAAGRIRTFLADWDAAYPLDSTGVLADIPASYNNGLTPCRELMLADLRAVLAERVTEYEAVPSLVAVDFTSQPTEDRIRQWREAYEVAVAGRTLTLWPPEADLECECGCQPGQPCACTVHDCECVSDEHPCPVCDAPDAEYVDHGSESSDG